MQEATLTCPHCQHAGRHELLPFLDLNKHPKQKLAILTDSLFTVNCPSCAKQFTVLHELLVVDEKQHIGLLLAPQSEVRELDGDGIGRQGLQSYTLRLVSTAAGLKEKILLLDSNLDDRTIELCKLYLTMYLQKPDVQLYFAEYQTQTDKLLFSVLDGNGALEGSIECEDELYEQLLQTAQQFPLKPGFFTAVDQRWAYEHIRNSADQ
jgi:hypothetical protein